MSASSSGSLLHDRPERPDAAGGKVLVVDDQKNMRATTAMLLREAGHVVAEAEDGAAAVQRVRQEAFDVVLTDLRMPGLDGMEVLRHVRAASPETQVIVMTAYGTIESAVEAVRQGAHDYVSKPFQSEELLLRVARALETRRLRGTVTLLAGELRRQTGLDRIIGRSAAVKDVIERVVRVAPTDASVLITGESGTGKELVARALHLASRRGEEPFVPVNCAAITETLLESELFGHEKGAFTGATARKPGRFELAHHGTLFLDEIGDLPLGLQAKILRALETRRFERVGGTVSLHVDVRVVAATNRRLKTAVMQRQFREDLYFRLSVFPVEIPALRERTGDIEILARHFIDRYCREMRKKPLALSSDALSELQAYTWPGNVRELQNCIERAVILADGDVLHARQLNLSFREVAGAPPPSPWEQIDLSGTLADASRRVLNEVERRKIAQAIREAAGNKPKAAEVLQVSYKTLLMKMKEQGIEN